MLILSRRPALFLQTSGLCLFQSDWLGHLNTVPWNGLSAPPSVPPLLPLAKSQFQNPHPREGRVTTPPPGLSMLCLGLLSSEDQHCREASYLPTCSLSVSPSTQNAVIYSSRNVQLKGLQKTQSLIV